MRTLHSMPFFGNSESVQATNPSGYHAYLTAEQFQKLQQDRQQTGSSKQLISSATTLMYPSVLKSLSELSTLMKLPVEGLQDASAFRLSGFIRHAFEKAVDHKQFNAYIGKCLSNLTKWHKREVLGYTYNKYMSTVHGWFAKAKKQLNTQGARTAFSKEDLLSAALPHYVDYLNRKRESEYRTGHKKSFTILKLSELPPYKRRELENRLALILEKYEQASALPCSLQGLVNERQAIDLINPQTDLLEPTSQSTQSIGYWRRFTPEEQKLLLQTSCTDRAIRMMMAADTAETEGLQAWQGVQTAFNLTELQSRRTLTKTMYKLKRRLIARQAQPKSFETGVDQANPSWAFRHTLQKMPVSAQTRLLATLCVGHAWSLIYDGGLLGRTKITMEDSLLRLRLSAKNYMSNRRTAYKKLQPFLNLKAGKKAPLLPDINPYTALSLLPPNVFEAMLGKLPAHYQQALRLQCNPAISRRREAKEEIESVNVSRKKLTGQAKQAITLLGRQQIEVALQEAYQ